MHKDYNTSNLTDNLAFVLTNLSRETGRSIKTRCSLPAQQLSVSGSWHSGDQLSPGFGEDRKEGLLALPALIISIVPTGLLLMWKSLGQSVKEHKLPTLRTAQPLLNVAFTEAAKYLRGLVFHKCTKKRDSPTLNSRTSAPAFAPTSALLMSTSQFVAGGRWNSPQNTANLKSAGEAGAISSLRRCSGPSDTWNGLSTKWQSPPKSFMNINRAITERHLKTKACLHFQLQHSWTDKGPFPLIFTGHGVHFNEVGLSL